MNRDKYILLYEKFLAGECTEAEQKLLMEYIDSVDMEDYPLFPDEEYKSQVKAQIAGNLHKSIHSPKKTSPIFKRLYWLAAACIVMMASAIGIYQYRASITVNIPVKQKIAIRLNNDVKPGITKATLQLADGSVIELSNTQKGLITDHDGVQVKQDSNGQLVYDMSGGSAAQNAAVAVNTITTPVGGQYQVVLNDGTKVWLNAASSLTFPTVFSGTERKVKVTGEVYFEVAKNAEKPFLVNFGDNTIKVLGTHFNVNAYTDEQKSKVTLVEGAIDLHNTQGHVLLKPGMQAQVKADGAIATRTVNTDAVVAWKNGLFVFDDENIESIMRKIERWYSTQTVYNGDMAGRNFSGTISKYQNVSEVLDMLELTDAVHFNLEGRRITVTP